MTTPFSTICEPGAVVLVPFKFAGRHGVKPRPAVILSVDEYHRSRIDAVMMALTTNMDDHYFGDCDLQDWASANLPKPTKAKGVIQTIEQKLIRRRFGTLSPDDFTRVRDSLREIMGI